MNNSAADWTVAKTHEHPISAPTISDDEIDLGELFSLFWRRKFLMIGALLLSMILGILYVKQVPSLYEAEAKLILESQEQNASGLEALAPGLSDEDVYWPSENLLMLQEGK